MSFARGEGRLPGPPTAPITTDLAHDSLTLSWGPPASTGGQAVAGYRIFAQEGGAQGFHQIIASTGTPDTAAYRVRGLKPQVWYEFRVAALHAGGAMGAQSGSSLPVQTPDRPSSKAPAGMFCNWSIIVYRTQSSLVRCRRWR